MALGHKSVKEAQRWIDSAEFTEWMAFYRLEPFGGERDDLRSAIVAATIANGNRDPKKRPRAFTPSDFMPTFYETPSDEEVKMESMKRKIEILNAMMGGKDLRKKTG